MKKRLLDLIEKQIATVKRAEALFIMSGQVLEDTIEAYKNLEASEKIKERERASANK